MQTRPKLLHYGLSWPISGAFANPNCALAGRDCSIQSVSAGRNAKIIHLPCELLSCMRYLSPSIICAQKLFFSILKNSFPCWIFHLLIAYHKMPVMTSLECLKRAFIWHELNSLSCHTYIILKCAEWQLYLQVQTGASTVKVLLCENYRVFLYKHINAFSHVWQKAGFGCFHFKGVNFKNTNVQFGSPKFFFVGGKFQFVLAPRTAIRLAVRLVCS